jgi:hypothetical protein
MKKIIILVLTGMWLVSVYAQTVNQDTVAKYSRKEEQLKIFNRIATDIHLDRTQQEKFNHLSGIYADKAIAVFKNNTGRRELMQGLRKVGEEYWDKLKVFISPAQLDLMKDEREKYHFGKRFLVKSKSP